MVHPAAEAAVLGLDVEGGAGNVDAAVERDEQALAVVAGAGGEARIGDVLGERHRHGRGLVPVVGEVERQECGGVGELEGGALEGQDGRVLGNLWRQQRRLGVRAVGLGHRDRDHEVAELGIVRVTGQLELEVDRVEHGLFQRRDGRGLQIQCAVNRHRKQVGASGGAVEIACRDGVAKVKVHGHGDDALRDIVKVDAGVEQERDNVERDPHGPGQHQVQDNPDIRRREHPRRHWTHNCILPHLFVRKKTLGNSRVVDFFL